MVHGPSQHFIIERFCNIKIKLSSSSVKSEAVSSLDPFFPGQLSAGAEEMLFIKRSVGARLATGPHLACSPHLQSLLGPQG